MPHYYTLDQLQFQLDQLQSQLDWSLEQQHPETEIKELCKHISGLLKDIFYREMELPHTFKKEVPLTEEQWNEVPF